MKTQQKWWQRPQPFWFTAMSYVILISIFFLVQRYPAVAAYGSASQSLLNAASASTQNLTVPYQFILTNTNGQLITGNRNVSVGIYAASTGGTPLWSESHSNLPIVEGVGRIDLGGQTSGGIPANLWNDAPIYLSLTIGAETLAPRELLNPPTSLQVFTKPSGSVRMELIGDNGPVFDVVHVKSDGSSAPALTVNQNGTLISSSPVDLMGVNNNGTQDVVLRQDGSQFLHLLPWGGPGHIWDSVCIGCGAAADLLVRGSITQGAIIEKNLQTEEELLAGEIPRFDEGDVLCWDAEQQALTLCVNEGSLLVVAVADAKGRPIIMGAEPIKVIGPVDAGDLLVASGTAGYAMAWRQHYGTEPPQGTVIAKALESQKHNETGSIMSMITSR